MPYLGICGREYLLGRGYALSQSGETEGSVVAPTRTSPFVPTPPTYNELLEPVER